ncbi:putative glycosyl hydrolase [Xylariales sp. AK1849]|nr:putative glycosyl hydrolase [Xylariales sp. AK1849]
MTAYNQSSGLWNSWDLDTPWWQSGIALQATIDYMSATGTDDYLPMAYYTVTTQRAPLPWWPEGNGDFRADSTDDTGWWALALTSMYSLTGEEWLLDIAKEDEAYMTNYWSDSECNGGLIWNIPDLTYKNAISNELYIELTATLHNLTPGDMSYLNQSLTAWEWFANSGMINSEWLINDGLAMDSNGSCVNNQDTTWTYNQGVILGGLVQLFHATGDADFLTTARHIADAVLSSTQLSPGGILTEPCPAGGCPDQDGGAFKGIFIRYLAKLNKELPDRPYGGFISDNAANAYQHDRSANRTSLYGMEWQGPFDNRTLGRQESAVMLLVAALGT